MLDLTPEDKEVLAGFSLASLSAVVNTLRVENEALTAKVKSLERALCSLQFAFEDLEEYVSREARGED